MISKHFFFASLFIISTILNLKAQSFQETNIPGLTTTPSASRSANFIDVNGDGWDDIFITNGPFSGQNNMLYLNNQNNSFTTVTSDIITLDGDRSDGASFADVDNDGDLDAFVVTFGANGVGKKNYFYRNNGDGTFSYEADIAMGIPLTYSEMATWIDVNNDQNLDLYFTNSVGNLRNMYFENQGDGTFQGSISLAITNDLLPSRSIDWIDYDNDGDCDLFVTNEGGNANSLFRNDGANNFTQITNSAITMSFRNSTGSSWGDIDNDGDFDLFVANYGNTGQANQLFINDNGNFTEDVNSVIAAPITNSFGSSFADVDNDGDIDLFVCNAFMTGQNTNFLYINDGHGNFTQDTVSELANHQGWTFGCAFGDYDNNGWMDLVLANTQNENQTNSLYKNTGSGNNWVKLKCTGTESNTSAVGAKVRIRAQINGEEVWQTRKIAASSGYCSQNSYSVHFGLGDATSIDEIIVDWPNGSSETFEGVTVNGMHTLLEGDGTLGSDHFTLPVLRVSPNPVNTQLNIQLSEPLDEDIEIKVHTLTGQTVIREHFAKTTSANFGLDVQGLKNGLYILSIMGQNNLLGMTKFIKN